MADDPTLQTRARSPILPWIALLLVMAVVAAIRMRWLNVPIERDEGEFAYIGQLMLHGVAPFDLAYTLKIPGTAAVYAMIMFFLGENIAAIHMGVLLVNLGSMALVFVLGRRWLGAWYGVTAALSEGLLALSPAVLGQAGHATHFVVVAALGGIAMLDRPAARQNLWTLLAGGLLLGLAVTMKQAGATFGLFGAALALGHLYSDRAPLRRYLSTSAWIALGGAIPMAVTYFLLWRAGVFSKFWFWTVTYAKAYISMVSGTSAWALFKLSFGQNFRYEWPLWILAAVGFFSQFFDRTLGMVRLKLAGLLLSSFVALSAGLLYRPHYFVLVLPVVSLFAAAGLRAIWRGFKAAQLPPIVADVCASAIVITAAAIALFIGRNAYFLLDIETLGRRLYPENPFSAAEPIAQYIKQHTQPDEHIAILGSEPEIFFLAQRRSSSGYLCVYPLVESHGFAQQMQEEMIREVEADKPAFVILVQMTNSWLRTPASPPLIFDWTNRYTNDHYHVVGVVHIQSPATPTFYWDEKVGMAPREWHGNRIVVLRRNAR